LVAGFDFHLCASAFICVRQGFERIFMAASRDDLHEQIEDVEWHWLKPHLERDALIVVQKVIDLVEAAARIAEDDTAIVSAWIAAGHLGKPSAEEIDSFNAEPTHRFRMLVVQPWVLIQKGESH
jgi:hypothetical protein